ncbi:hypothetical protein [Pseudomonas farris]
MNSKIFSNKTVGFFSEKPKESLPPNSNVTGTTIDPPVLGYLAFYTNLLQLFWGSEKWGVVLPMEIAQNLPVIMPISTRTSDAGAMIQVRWSAIDGSVEYVSPPTPISKPGNVELIAIPTSEIEKFSAKTASISYALIQHDNETISTKLKITVAPQLIYKKAIIEGLVDGVLNTSDYPNGLKTTIPPIKNLRKHNAISLYWTVEYDSHVLFQHSETVCATKPNEDFLFNIPTHAYAPYGGYNCKLQYYIWLGAEMDPSLRWSTGIIDFDLK